LKNQTEMSRQRRRGDVTGIGEEQTMSEAESS
jgi:hypothetical protein